MLSGRRVRAWLLPSAQSSDLFDLGPPRQAKAVQPRARLPASEIASERSAFSDLWRRERDSNPRYPFG